jgi:glycosyltransferase involved in cell wall biosynthesis
MSRLLADFWYGRELNAVMLDDLLAARPVLKAFCRIVPLRALLLLTLSRRYDAVIPDWYAYGRLFVVLAAFGARRKTILMEFIDFGAGRGRLVAWLAKTLLGPCLRGAVLGIHVMSRFECDLLGERYGLERSRLHFVPFPLLWQPGNLAPFDDATEGVVLSAGRGGCDWPTLFAAAEQSHWNLVVVCAKGDLALVTRLNARIGAEIHCDLPRAAYDSLLARASVFVAALREERKSSGHIRFGHAIAAMVPAVVTDTTCMGDYLIDGVTGAAVPVGDSAALAAKVDSLLADAEARRRLTQSAYTNFSGYHKEAYFSALGAVLANCLAQAGAGRQ